MESHGRRSLSYKLSITGCWLGALAGLSIAAIAYGQARGTEGQVPATLDYAIGAGTCLFLLSVVVGAGLEFVTWLRE